MRDRLLALDGLRGIAAIAVLCFHVWPHTPADWLFGSARLAVDFFFLLSGFVLARAYDDRLAERGGPWRFLRNRALRLYPLLMLGSLPLALNLVQKTLIGQNLGYPLPLLTVVAGMLCLPAPWLAPGPPIQFPLNSPLWSLFWEIVLNIGFALGGWRLSRKALAVFVITAGGALLARGVVYHQFGSTQLGDGLRALYAFPAGVLLYRLQGRLPRVAMPAGVASALLLASFMMPGAVKGYGWYCGLVVLLLYPAIVHGAASAVPLWPRTSALLGELSYPLYVLHWPVHRLLPQVLAKLHLALDPFAEGAVVFVASVAVAWCGLVLVDRPLRAHLARRRSRLVHGYS